MATRTIQFRGAAYSDTGQVSLAVKFNNQTVHNGTVNTRNEALPLQVTIVDTLFTFEITTDDIGVFPLEIVVSGGDLVFSNLLRNYTGFELQKDENGDPVVVDNQYVAEVAPVDYYQDMNDNTVNTDGKQNVQIVPDPYAGAYNNRPAEVPEQYIGDWNYVIADGSTFTCSFNISESRLHLDIPAYVP